MHILQGYNLQKIKQLMRDIHVDPYGIEIMASKALHYLVKIDSVSNITANILKQEMLSLGGDAAIARGALTGKVKKTDCLLMGTLSQIRRLNTKLHRQPFGLNELARKLTKVIEDYQLERFVLQLGRHKLELGRSTRIMGIINLTPDSFSGDGLCKSEVNCSRSTVSKAIDYARKIIDDGADILDVGGESSRPGAKPVPVKEELARTIPLIRKLAKTIKVPLSIDTCKPEVAKQALDNGAAIVNDITGLKDRRMASLVKRYKAGVVIMHMKGNPRTMQKKPEYNSLIDEISGYFSEAFNVAREAGIDREKIIIDPGIGFGKTLEHNLEILNHLGEFKALGRPIMVGTSRKSFLGKILNTAGCNRIYGTVSSCVLASKNGANIVRVHDVKEVRQAMEVSDAINGAPDWAKAKVSKKRHT